MRCSSLILASTCCLLCNAARAEFPFKQEAPVSFAFTSQSCRDLKPDERMRCERYGALGVTDCHALGNVHARNLCLLDNPGLDRPPTGQVRSPKAPTPAIPFLQAPPELSRPKNR